MAPPSLTCFAQASTVRRLSESWSAGGRVAYDDFEYDDAYAYDPPPASWGHFRDRAYDRGVTAEVRADWSRGTSVRTSAGLTAEAHWTYQEAYSDDLPSLEEDPVNGVGVGPIPKDYRALNAWALGEVQILPSLRLQAGATFYVHQIFGSRLTPKVSAVWRPTPADVVKVLYAEGFRAPTAAEASTRTAPTSPPTPNWDRSWSAPPRWCSSGASATSCPSRQYLFSIEYLQT